MKNETFNEYAQVDALSASVLKALQRSVAHGVIASMYSSKKTPDLKFGEAFHKFILEPKTFEDSFYILNKKLDKRKTEDKSFWKEKVDKYGEDSILSLDDSALLNNMKKGAYNNPSVAKILNSIEATEKSIYWSENGVNCKARFDGYSSKLKAVIDIKTTKDASAENFSRSLYNFGYHLQASHYLSGANHNNLNVDKFIFIAIEKEAPFCSMAYVIGEETLVATKTLREDLLQKWKRYLTDNKITGYSDKVEQIEIPRYGLNSIEKSN